MQGNNEKENKFARFLKRVFVHNAGLKILALLLSAGVLVLMIITN